MGVMRVSAAPGGRCWMCGMTAISGERLPGRGHKVRLLCRTHDALVFGGARNVAQPQNRAGERGSGAVDGAGRPGEAGPARR
jgi:hypothetical protein